MKCNKCGTEVNPQDEFCYNCGAQITRKKENKKDKQKNEPEVQEYKLKDKEIEKLSQSFASRDEKYIASLGNGYIMNYLTNGSMSKGFAFITDKRVYFKGSCLSGTGKKLVKTNEERTVDVKNITGSGFTYHRYWGILIALFLSILASLAGAIGGIFLTHYVSFRQYRHNFSNYVSTYYSGSYNATGVITSDTETERWEELLDIVDELTWEKSDSNSNGIYNWEASYNGETICEIYWVDFVGRYYIGINNNHDNLCYDNGYSLDTIDSIVKLTEELIPRKLESWHNYKAEETRIHNVTFLKDLLSCGLGISLVIVCCIGIKNYLLKRKTLFRIEYAGGCIAFDVSFYAKAEIDDFQKQLRRVKDFAEETSTIKTVAVETPTQAPVQTSTQNSVPDDLRKYADLLKDGLISQEEYDAMKKKILGL